MPFLLSGFAHAQLTEDFSDGDFTNNPAWNSSNISGNGADFQITDGELQSNGPSATATIWITTQGITALASGDIVWEFKARYGSAPSGSNTIDIFLASDKSNLSDNPTGYFIRLGEGGSDDGIDLFKTSSSTPIIEDPNPSVATAIDARIRVTREVSGNWTLEADPTGGSAYAVIGSTVDTDFTTIGSYFGFKVKHTSTRNQDYYFDDITITLTDTGAPVVTSVEVVSATELTVTFSEEVEKMTAEEMSNYSVDNSIGSPISAFRDEIDYNIIHLTFSSAFQNAAFHELTVSNVEDLAGNAMTPGSIDFFYFNEVQASAKDIIINEIFADPNPPNDLPEVEYIEIYNNSSTVFDLANWSYSDQTSTAMLASAFLFPGDFLVLCPNVEKEKFEPYGNVMGLTPWPTLNNSGDYLYLKDKNGATVDSVNYSSSWYGDSEKSSGGWSLELINPNNQCHVPNNWTASTHSAGGTPGQVNSVFNESADVDPPKLLSANLYEENSLTLVFNEPLDPATIFFGRYEINTSVTATSIALSANFQELTLGLSAAIPTNVILTITVEGISDCSGNVIADDNSADFILVEDVPVAAKDVIINEIFPIPNDETELPNAEYVELLNRSNNILNLDGWTYSDRSTTAIINGLIIFPGDHIIITAKANEALFSPFGKIFGMTVWPTLNNDGDLLILKDKNGATIDSIVYNKSWYNSSSKAAGGWALELIDPENMCSDRSNWAASEDGSGGTPGKENSILSQKPDLTGPQLLAAYGLRPDSISLYFDEILDRESAINAQYSLEPAIGVSQVSISSNLTAIGLKLTWEMQNSIRYKVVVKNITDCSGNKIGEANTAEFNLIESADKNDVIINEILFNPRLHGVDFVEVYNKSAKYINLKDWKLANANSGGAINQIKTITNKNLVLAPEQYLALTSDATIIKEHYPFSHDERFLTMSTLPAYSNSSGEAFLLQEDSSIMDQFSYAENYHFELLADKKGVSLERVSFFEPTNNISNWKSAASTVGYATPGYKNSQSRAHPHSSEGKITIAPKVIVPDGSGSNGFTTISYSFSQPGFVANARIMDLQGRTIKVLSENDYLPAEGFYTWDGTDNNMGKVKTGYYLIFFEVFDLTGEVLQFKEKVVVGTTF